jgi:hypothetical protein
MPANSLKLHNNFLSNNFKYIIRNYITGNIRKSVKYAINTSTDNLYSVLGRKVCNVLAYLLLFFERCPLRMNMSSLRQQRSDRMRHVGSPSLWASCLDEATVNVVKRKGEFF